MNPKTNIPMNKNRTKLLICFFCFFLLFSCIPSGVNPVSSGDSDISEEKHKAFENKTILLINSDASVNKYKAAHQEFQKAIPHSFPVMEVDLADKTWGIPDVEELLADEDPGIIYCIGSKAYLIANRFASEKNIVFSSIVNWLRLPVTPKTYGVSNELHAVMQLMLFRYIFPDIQKIGVLYSEKYTGQWFEKVKTEAKEMGVGIIGYAVSERNSIPALNKLLPDINAFWLISDPEILSGKKDLLEILNVCGTRKIPVFSYHEAFAELGAALIISADNYTIGRQSAGIVAEILSGSRIDEKVQFPAGSHIIMNLRKVKEFGLRYSEDALGSVNHIIE